MIRVSTENLLADEYIGKKKKIRNYSFSHSKRLPLDKMTQVNGVKIPSMPGSCYHAIIASLAENKDHFCNWDKIIDLTHKNMRMYGGQSAWDKFSAKGSVKSYKQRIKDNTHTLTRRGQDCYGYRLHEQGMSIYYFKDGAMLVTGGELSNGDGSYDVVFSDGRKLQTRYRGTTMTYKEYKTFMEKGFIDNTGRILQADSIKKFRSNGSGKSPKGAVVEEANVCVVLKEGFDQGTAVRLESIGLNVDHALDNELIGTIVMSRLEELKIDPDVAEVEVSGE